MNVSQYILITGSAFLAGTINSVAGGGSLFTFPALLAVGMGPVAANATSTVALVPGSASAAWGFRAAIRDDRTRLWSLAVPSTLFGGAGALLVMQLGDNQFGPLVPWLVLLATGLFALQSVLARRKKPSVPVESVALDPATTAAQWRWTLVAQIPVAFYGGFFGAGIGIMMLAILGLTGMRDVFRMNGLKNFAAVCINAIASCAFAAGHVVDWKVAAIMAVGAILGGILGARVARRLGAERVRQIVIGVGVLIAASSFLRR